MKKIFLLVTIFCYVLMAQEPGSGRISGYVFGDYYYNVSRDTSVSSISNKALSGEKDLNGFTFRRIYLTYDYNIDADFSTRLRLEGEQATAGNNRINVTIKDAWVKWKNFLGFTDMIIGIQPTPEIEAADEIWRYRVLEKTMLDLRGLLSSRDFGISFKGSFDKNKVFSYQFMFGNNSNVIQETDRYKRVYANLGVTPGENFKFNLYADYIFRTKKSYSNIIGSSYNNDAYTFSAIAGYGVKDKYNIALQGALQVNKSDNFIIEEDQYFVEDRNASGLSLFGWYSFDKKISLIGRVDYFDNNSRRGFTHDARNYFIFGVNYMPVPNVMFIPNVQVETYEGNDYDTAVTARLTFYWSFL